MDRSEPMPKAALLRSPAFLGHETGSHPENPRRLRAIEAELERAGLLAGRPEVPFGPASREHLERVHDPRYLDLLEDVTADGGGWLDGDTLVGPDSLETARLAAGAAVAAVDAAVDGRARRSFVLCRPPGHHATADQGMGFCLLNNIAVGAAQALARGLGRVLIFDWDVHHGNGTQDIFYGSDGVLFCSIHQHPFYPGTGWTQEKGTGPGKGLTLNAPLPGGQTDAIYLRIIDELFRPAMAAFAPEMVLVSAGFDGHVADPIGGMRLSERGYAAMTRRMIDLAEEYASGRLVLVLEGGYDPGALARSVAAVVRTLDGAGRDEYDDGDARTDPRHAEEESSQRR